MFWGKWCSDLVGVLGYFVCFIRQEDGVAGLYMCFGPIHKGV